MADIDIKIKAMMFNRLIKELHSLKDMYIEFSKTNDNIIAGSAFHIVAKDLSTLLNKYDERINNHDISKK